MLLDALKKKNKSVILILEDIEGIEYGIVADKIDLDKTIPEFIWLKNESIELKFTGYFLDGERQYDETCYKGQVYVNKKDIKKILVLNKEHEEEL